MKREIQKWKEAGKTPPPSEDEKQNILLKCQISISKYAKVVLLAKSFMQRNSSMEIRIVDSEKYDAEKQKEVERETFALIRLKGIKVTHLLWLCMMVVVVAVGRPSLSMINISDH